MLAAEEDLWTFDCASLKPSLVLGVPRPTKVQNMIVIA